MVTMLMTKIFIDIKVEAEGWFRVAKFQILLHKKKPILNILSYNPGLKTEFLISC